ncbi:hypothetical protein G6F32_011464 [Rhizopus arrhizus]|nr:hypothetical protein G6F32_011464 [Rhizopus arrhizus]
MLPPFSTSTLLLFSRRLLNYPTFKLKYQPNVKEASVLMPLCIVDDKPSVLFTVRNMNMRTHRGEISFPGGKQDPTDESLEGTALRETFEEIGYPPFNPDEVSRVFTLPVEYLIDRKNREIKQFRNSSIKYPVFKVPNDIQEGEKEIWGLTSFILDGVFRKIIPKHYP